MNTRFLLLVPALALCAGLVLAAEKQVPLAAEIIDCKEDQVKEGLVYWKGFSVTCEEFKAELQDSHVVPERTWLNEYSHVLGGDRSGEITIRSGAVVRWIIRPGGLGWLVWPDGEKQFLVLCQCKHKPASSPTTR